MREHPARSSARFWTGDTVLVVRAAADRVRRDLVLRLVSLTSVVALLCACSTGTPPPVKRKVAVNYSGLIHQFGAYGVGTDPEQVINASHLGIGLVVGPPVASAPQYQQALRTSDIRVIDNTPERMIYQVMCPSGFVSSCSTPSTARLGRLRHSLANYVRSKRTLSQIAAYYILDDYVPNIGSVLSSVYQTLRHTDPTRPLVCAFSLPVMPADADAASVASRISVFKRNLRNYSPKWCDAVMLFSYAPGSVSPKFGGPYDWGMTKTLPKALSVLRNRGWRQSSSPLIGVPQTFKFWPRQPAPGTPQSLQYREGPSTTELTTQVAAFCRAGATAIVAYAWRTAIQKTVFALYNSPAFQLGLLAGVEQCRRDFWT